MDTTDCRHRIPGNGNHNTHLQHKLEQVGPQHTPEPAQSHIESGERNQEEDTDPKRISLADTHCRSNDAGHCLCDPAQD